MARSNRELSSDFPLHVYARSNNRDRFPIPLEEVWSILEDYLFLLKVGFSIEIISVVLMPNHFHLIVRDPKMNLPAAMKFFMRETSKEINRRSGRINHMWGGPFESSVIKSLDYYYTCYRYVYRNPVAAGLTDSVLNYHFSSLAILLGQRSSMISLAEDLTLFSSLESTIAWLEDESADKHRDQIKKSLKYAVMEFVAERKSRKPFRLPPHHFH